MFNIAFRKSARKSAPVVVSHIHELSVDQAVNAFLVTLDKQADVDFAAAYDACAYAREHNINSPSRIWTHYHNAVFAALGD